MVLSWFYAEEEKNITTVWGWIPHVSLGKCQKDQCAPDTAITALKCAPHRIDDRWMIKKNCLTLVLVKAENHHVFAQRWPVKDRCRRHNSRETEIGRISFYGRTRSGVCDPYRGIVPRENKHYSLICTLLCIVISKTAGQQPMSSTIVVPNPYSMSLFEARAGVCGHLSSGDEGRTRFALSPELYFWKFSVNLVWKYIQLSHFNFSALKG